MKADIYNLEGEKTKKMDLSDSVFNLAWNQELVWQVFESERSNRRRGTANAKTRGEVRGGGIKPWKQKGTGRARHGSIRSPIWRGGGVTHGPLKEKDYSKKINKKMKKKALFVVLSQKMRDGEIFIFDNINFETGRTKNAASFFKTINKKEEFKALKQKRSILIPLASPNTATTRALRNIPGVRVDEARNVDLSGVLNTRYIFLPKESIKALESRATVISQN
ncbi:MAG: 50S ribosomal protein L4 [Candidatus Niyogibacteria bacterium CG10_big_fil_rev_8_21_14_0_10_42_19]|uniref:Large ribosomal subunit protein uL4 n=1 Tax=Candidatus Niyogibacteria bacterium CG10_big_fil_rev_8_21_14_0_10_42_19 TaxID=1974725 RepID=A0A2H0TFC0_9BACT|nr:MAG: 50S ribosomal protein L4 [Candidatus Niyogibacteria bacterium CG10_big_fil_rev_8_21_14_0_10_42_19]